MLVLERLNVDFNYRQHIMECAGKWQIGLNERPFKNIHLGNYK